MLHLQSCSDCGVRQHPPRYFCRACTSPRLTWKPVDDGNGTLHTWSIIYRSGEPGWSDLVPYAVGVIQLADGVRLLGYIDGIPLDGLRLDMPVTVRAVPQDGAALLVIGAAEG
jgi:uncharacterized protein